jgi:hypothetical protein
VVILGQIKMLQSTQENILSNDKILVKFHNYLPSHDKESYSH